MPSEGGQRRVYLQHHLALLGKLQRVSDQVVQYLAQPRGIAFANGGHAGFHVASQLQILLVRRKRERPHHFIDKVAQVERGFIQLQPARFDLREIQHIVDHRQQSFRRSPHDMNILALFGREIGIEDQLCHAQNPVHGGAHFVAHVRQEFALGAIGRFGRIFGQAEFAFHPLALRGRRQHVRHGLQEVHVLTGEFALRRRNPRSGLPRAGDRRRWSRSPS